MHQSYIITPFWVLQLMFVYIKYYLSLRCHIYHTCAHYLDNVHTCRWFLLLFTMYFYISNPGVESIFSILCTNYSNTLCAQINFLEIYKNTYTYIHTCICLEIKSFDTFVLAAIQLDVSLSSSHFFIHFRNHIHLTGSCQFSPQAKLK